LAQAFYQQFKSSKRTKSSNREESELTE